MNKQSGFTLLELMIAMAIFALLGLASWKLFDGLVRVQQSTNIYETELRNLQRAVAVIERDVLHITEQPIVLRGSVLQLQRSNWRNPLDQPRSERQQLSYRLDNGVLWRETLGEGARNMRQQKLLENVQELAWRLYDPVVGWSSEVAPGSRAIELQLTVGRFEAIRRVMLLPGGLP